MADLVRALAVSELPPGSCREVTVQGRRLAFFNVAGRVYATSNVCPHRGGPLGQGMLEGGLVFCPSHAWAFDVSTGICPDDPDLRVATYPVTVEAGQVLVQVD